jgi:thiosulfate/3-mercaptopyruvate sulfurtransferase
VTHRRESAIFSIIRAITYKLYLRMEEFDTPLLTIATEVAERLEDPNWVIIDCRFNLMQTAAGREAWSAGHVPGAFYADLDQDLAGPITSASGRHPLPNARAFRCWLGSMGIGPETTVVAYDDAGGAIAARLWWLLRWAGHTDVRLLDGGLPGWIDAGLTLSTDTPTASAVRYPQQTGTLPVVSTQALVKAIAKHSLTITDARDAERFAGRKEPIDARAGHVPGAVNLPFADNLDNKGRFLSAHELRQRYNSIIGDRSVSDVACMCGSGVTACHTLFALELAGLPGASLYVGSWSEWIRDEKRSVATTES